MNDIRRPRPDARISAQGLTAERRKNLPPLVAIRAFEAIGTCGGIRRAASALSIDHAAVSRHLRTLEQWAGVPLAHRGAGSGGQLTPEGQRYYERIAKALLEIASASMELTHRSDDNMFRLWCAPGIASDWLSGRLACFERKFPSVELELHPTEVAPDFSTHEAEVYLHYLPDIAREENADSGLRSVEIARPPILAVASPDFIANAEAITTPADLLRTTLLHEASFDQWLRWFKQHDIDASSALGGPKFGQGHLTLAAARKGHGVALANALLVGDDLSTNALVEVSRWRPVHLGGYMFTARRDRWHGRLVLGFRRWLETEIAAEPWHGIG